MESLKSSERDIGGRAVFFTDGSRPYQNPISWAYEISISVILKQGAYKYDKKILISTGRNKKTEKNKKLWKSLEKDKRCRRVRDGKIFELPMKLPKQCRKGVKGYSMKSSCVYN